MNTTKTVLISAATFAALALFQAHPVICSIVLYIALNWITTYICCEAEGKGNFNEQFDDEDSIFFGVIVTIAGTIISICFVLYDLIKGNCEAFNNIWKYLFKTEPPVIKFQSPIIIQKAVDPESDVE